VRINIGYNPTLTNQKAMDILSKNLTYEINTTKVNSKWFLVIKNNLVSAAVQVKQRKNDTQIVVRGYIHEFYMRLLLIIFIMLPYYIVSLGPAESFAKSIAKFIESSPDFRATT